MEVKTEVELNQQNIILIAQVLLIVASFIILMVKISKTR